MPQVIIGGLAAKEGKPLPAIEESKPLSVAKARQLAGRYKSGERWLDLLERDREELFARALAADPESRLDGTVNHPFFGPLNCLEWAGFQRVHDLDHIQHARRIIAAVSD